MTDHRDKLVVLRDRTWATGRQSGRSEELRGVLAHLDELNHRLQQFSPHPTWSAQRWMIASTPFRMRLTGARRRLGGLTASHSVSSQTDLHWIGELKDASALAERRIQDIDACLRTLQHAATSLPARAQETEVFITSRSELMEAVGRIRDLLCQRFPELPGRYWRARLTGMCNGPQSRPEQARMRGVAMSASNAGGADAAGARPRTGLDLMVGTGLDVREALREADGILRAMVRAYEEEPSAIDGSALNNTGPVMSLEGAITGTFRLLDARVYAKNSPIRSDGDIWEAFGEQREEFIGFYRSALAALEAYREVLQAYCAVKRRCAAPQPGDLQWIRWDKRVQLEERDACIQAFTDFQRKFSAMIVVLHPVTMP
jgi:hypothetical protein